MICHPLVAHGSESLLILPAGHALYLGAPDFNRVMRWQPDCGRQRPGNPGDASVGAWEPAAEETDR